MKRERSQTRRMKRSVLRSFRRIQLGQNHECSQHSLFPHNHKVESIPFCSAFLFWKNLWRLGVQSLGIQYNSPGKPSEPRLFFFPLGFLLLIDFLKNCRFIQIFHFFLIPFWYFVSSEEFIHFI